MKEVEGRGPTDAMIQEIGGGGGHCRNSIAKLECVQENITEKLSVLGTVLTRWEVTGTNRRGIGTRRRTSIGKQTGIRRRRISGIESGTRLSSSTLHSPTGLWWT